MQSAKVYLCDYINRFYIQQCRPFYAKAIVIDMGVKTFDLFVFR